MKRRKPKRRGAAAASTRAPAHPPHRRRQPVIPRHPRSRYVRCTDPEFSAITMLVSTHGNALAAEALTKLLTAASIMDASPYGDAP